MKFKKFMSKSLICSFVAAGFLIRSNSTNAIFESSQTDSIDQLREDTQEKKEKTYKEFQDSNQDFKKLTLKEFLDSNQDYEVVFEDIDGINKTICILAKKDDVKICENIANQNSKKSVSYKPIKDFFDEENNIWAMICLPYALTDEESNLI